MEKVTKKRKENQGSHYLYIALYNLFQPRTWSEECFGFGPLQQHAMNGMAWHGMAWHGMAWHMSATYYANYIARELATSRFGRLRAVGRVGARAACENHVGTVLRQVLKHAGCIWMLDTCWISSGPALTVGQCSQCLKYFCAPARIIHPKRIPNGRLWPAWTVPTCSNMFQPWSHWSRGSCRSCGSMVPGRSGSRTRRSWQWRVRALKLSGTKQSRKHNIQKIRIYSDNQGNQTI